MRISNSGEMRYCRWADYAHSAPVAQVSQTSPLQYFQHTMAPLRQQLARGESPAGCQGCLAAEPHGKISGRKRQLLKTGIVVGEFEKTSASSTWISEFVKSEHTGETVLGVQDWQIDLGNYCNSNCIFCSPAESSRLAAEFKRIGFIKDLPPANWSDDPTQVDTVVSAILASRTKFIHFVGGETTITPAFKKILQALLSAGQQDIAISFTTNLTVWPQDIVDLLTQFQEVNLGMSVETFESVNDYVRWPSNINTVCSTLDQWIQVGQQHNWLMTLRITPTCLTVHGLMGVYQFAVEHSLNVESVNFLQRPEFLRPTVLPRSVTDSIADQLENWIGSFAVTSDEIVNVRSPNLQTQAALQDARSYVDYLRTAADESSRRVDLVRYLKQLETSRHNCILDYLPQYESLFRTAGY